jgi:hypothetical protein
MDTLERRVGKVGIMPLLWPTCLKATPRQARVEHLNFANDFTTVVDHVGCPLAAGYDAIFVGAIMNSIMTFTPSFHVSS